MKIAQLVSNLYSVPPKSSNAIYLLVSQLTDKLVNSGHDVTLYNTKQAETRAKLCYVTNKPVWELGDLTENERHRYMHLLVSKCYQNAYDYDLIHSHFNLIASYYAPIVTTPTVHTIHSPIVQTIKPILLKAKDQNFISISLAQRKQMPELNWIANIYHGVDLKKFKYNPKPANYFLFLGRITKEKGVHHAIAAAQAAKVNLRIAGKSYSHEKYWQKNIEPNIDGKQIRYFGEADNISKIDLIRNARAIIFPTSNFETFGMVMIEAMACGTPVIGYRVASVPEVVKHNRTGILVNDVSGIIKAIGKIDKISRLETRKRAEKYFSIDKMVTGYEKVYSKLIYEKSPPIAKILNRIKSNIFLKNN